MANKASRAGNGIGLGWTLFIIFMVLQLTHEIDWSWWWITAPLWGSIIIGFIGSFILAMLSDDKP